MRIQNILPTSILFLSPLFAMTKSSLMISYFILTMLTLLSIFFLVLLKYLLSITYPRVGFVGHDLTTYGNCPAASKFDLIKHWPLPPHAIYLLSFVRLYSFYRKYFPWFETNVKPLRKLQRKYHRQPIPILSLNPNLIALFHDCKTHFVTSSLLL